ncbi:ectomycorrhiza-regulated small secreted protein [Ephemerocybe angulata]|uniref:Ectomycorrhiza-regulated small secreted protein n=1 Tax=Ephemerocybe angulata TaxID=980116 RepID=A0A8H6M214_9AGAR|nr:ectomycorrhiza-regulated small secreted protein [Tulosesus angulatus]
MRFSTILLSLLAGTVTVVLAAPAALTEQEVFVRTDGDASVFQGREVTEDELRARDAAVIGDLVDVREYFSDAEVEELALRSMGLEERSISELQPRAIGAAVRIVAKGIEAIVKLIKGRIEHDKTERGKFTLHFVQEAHRKNPKFNWLIVHTAHTKDFVGKEGVGWGHRHQEFPVSFSKTIGYEIYYFKKGSFDLKGDGGYLNWAFSGNFKKNGKHVDFF